MVASEHSASVEGTVLTSSPAKGRQVCRPRPNVGFTLLELLIVIGVFGILATIGFLSLTRLNRQLTLEAAANELSQDFGRARSNALSTGANWRVRLTGPRSYVVEQEEDGEWVRRRGADYPTRISFTDPTFTGDDSDVIAQFDSRGFAQFQPSVLVVVLGEGGRELTVTPAMTGTARVR